jgi:hypothetical protein
MSKALVMVGSAIHNTFFYLSKTNQTVWNDVHFDIGTGIIRNVINPIAN